ncbi:permease [Bacillus suaedae]|uniref:Permease n=1 Tax=Halalkalibacter suaedae TaxID=2822140 RepID=A0A940WWD2_9BACI|nr:permease [Bacillus suaedae]MBP3953551.1 permease [Bacillus suaedae]
MDYFRKLFFILGSFFFVLSCFLIVIGILAKQTPHSSIYLMFAMAVMSFCMSYLYPQFKQKDERMKLIRAKGMFASFVALMSYLIIFNVGIQFELIYFTASQLIQILSTLMICTVFLSFVIFSKMY